MPRITGLVRLKGCGLALLLAALVLLAGRTALAQSAGTVIGISGDCFVVGSGRSVSLTLGQPVHIGDVLDVTASAKLKLRMADGSIVSVASGSRVTIRAYAVDAAGRLQDAALSLGRGLLRAIVAPVTGPARFEVDTAVGTAAARSTDWFVEAFPTSMQVAVLSGAVVMTGAATGASVAIPARWGARLESGRDPVPPRVWSQAEFDAVIARTEVP
ncbi:MAG: FecR domain-containing protein [Alphaproteobacteria bacterium]